MAILAYSLFMGNAGFISSTVRLLMASILGIHMKRAYLAPVFRRARFKCCILHVIPPPKKKKEIFAFFYSGLFVSSSNPVFLRPALA